MTETLLIQALQQKQQAAYKLLVDNYADKVLNTVSGFVQNLNDAEDITQEVFVKVFEGIHQFRGDAKLSTWIYRISVTKSLDFLRSKNRKKRFGFLFGTSVEHEEKLHSCDFEHPGIIAENKEQSKLLFAAIQQLPENQRTAFVLQKLEGLSQQEIAEIMRITSSAVESLLSRAKANLKKLLLNYYTSI